ncbi:type 2 periplasmic-binding domain-containing protein [Mesomycoplasma neurolyticum]|uniref:Uncharacterized protein n=1 Tax=Mesomycoplasma neurolyticum TaxID=2120 RepID=A0A449A5T3_9BACT|nr:hypothetical protein [Mesomycoplasma neurolyticum]VEU59582.1 Uncharacterised protein [Mesomycoplasma neurolyticum]
MKFKLNKKLFFGLLTISSLVPLISVVSCNDQENTALKTMQESFVTDEKIKEFKNTFAGYSKDQMEIMGSANEINEESQNFIKAFNKYYGTKLNWVQGHQMQKTISEKIQTNNGIGNILMFAVEPQATFEEFDKYTFDTDPAKVLDYNKNDLTGTITVGNKKFPAFTYSYFGVIYNRDTFNKNGVTVYEGASFDTNNEKNPDLIKGEAYDGTIEKDNKLYVFTNDLKESGYRKVISFLKSKGIDKPFYSIAKGGDVKKVWPISKHLFAAAVDQHGDLSNGYDDVDKVVNMDVVNAMKKAVEIMGYVPEKDGTEVNDTREGIKKVGTGTVAMVQGGAYNDVAIKKDDPDSNVGMFPLPIFNKKDQTAMIFRGPGHKWAITSLAKDESKLKTAKLFLHALHNSKTGYNYLVDGFKVISPYTKPEGANAKQKQGSLNDSGTKYDGITNVGSWAHSYLPQGMVYYNDKMRQLANEGYAQSDTLERLRTLYKENLETQKKRAEENKDKN